MKTWFIWVTKWRIPRLKLVVASGMAGSRGQKEPLGFGLFPSFALLSSVLAPLSAIYFPMVTPKSLWFHNPVVSDPSSLNTAPQLSLTGLACIMGSSWTSSVAVYMKCSDIPPSRSASWAGPVCLHPQEQPQVLSVRLLRPAFVELLGVRGDEGLGEQSYSEDQQVKY